MARTYKDRPSKLIYGKYDQDYIWLEGYYYIKCKTTKPKKRKKVDCEDHWMSTPSWWTRLTMNRPMRRAGKLWEKQVHREVYLDDTDPPGVSRKPHNYYW